MAYLYEVDMEHNIPTIPEFVEIKDKEGNVIERLAADPPRVLLHVRARDEAHCAARVATKFFNPIRSMTVLRELREDELIPEDAPNA